MSDRALESRLCGKRAEAAVAHKLEASGCRIIARNYRAGRFGELDIVAQKGEKIIITEVKARRDSSQWGGVSGSISGAKLRKIDKAARYLLRDKMLMNYKVIFLAGLVSTSKTGEIIRIDLIPLEIL